MGTLDATTTAAEGPRAHLRVRGALRRADFGDALVFLYLLTFARQYFWVVEHNAAAWILSVALSALAWYAYAATKPSESGRAGRQFWLVVGLPLLFIYALRAAFPDTSFDVLNYRLLHGERSLAGMLYAPGDFFPTPAPYNPAPDTLTALARHLLGYRLGTIVNLFAALWAARIADRILRPFVEGVWTRAACVLLVLMAEHALFEINNYMTDLLAVPLLLEATYLILLMDDEGVAARRTLPARIAFLLGAAVAFKLTNAVVALPLALACAYRALWGRRRLAPKEWPKAVGLALAAFVAPLLPFSIYLYKLTGSPVFPVFNGLFKSPFWPENSGWDTRWGPTGVWEKLAWPVVAFFEPSRHSELAVYSGRLSLGFVAAICGLIIARGDRRLRMLCVLMLSGSLLWSIAGMGYSRYGLFLELLSGVVLVALVLVLLRGVARPSLSWRTVAAALLSAALFAQAALAASYVSTHEWSMRPTFFKNPRAYFAEGREFLRDRSLDGFLSTGQAAVFDGAEVWIESGMKTSGIEVLLNDRAPVVGARHEEYFATRAGRELYVKTIRAAGAKRMLSLSFPEEADAARSLLESRGLQVVRARAVPVPFFSRLSPTTLMLFEVSPRAASLDASGDFWAGAPFPARDYRAEISTAAPPSKLKAGEKASLQFRIRNLGGSVWPARARDDGRFQVNLANRWLDAASLKMLDDMDGRTAMLRDLAPGEESAMALVVNAPETPGEYVLEIDLVHEGVAWFHEKGSQTLKLRVSVEP
ncbi:MAG TPA: hypothetical protein VFS10_00250 [Pyrinomonadaceae bacterium]|nr:hypothetical protein [Pyrinomonadaceae bacterium]